MMLCTYDAENRLVKTCGNTGVGVKYTYDSNGNLLSQTSSFYNYGYRDYSPQTVRFTTVDPIRDGANWFAYVNNDPVNYVDLWGLYMGERTTDYRMNEGEWKDDTLGNGIEGVTVGYAGCAVTEMSNVISATTGTETTPRAINDEESYFAPNKDDLDMRKVAEDNGLTFDYWTTERQGDLSTKITEIKNSSSEYYVSAQVKYNPEGNFHWVGITDIKIDADGNSSVKIAPSSIYDTQKSSRQRDTWVQDSEGSMWVATSDINKIYTYETNKKNK